MKEVLPLLSEEEILLNLEASLKSLDSNSKEYEFILAFKKGIELQRENRRISRELQNLRKFNRVLTLRRDAMLRRTHQRKARLLKIRLRAERRISEMKAVTSQELLNKNCPQSYLMT
jgi:hypothetical protein